MQKAASGQKAEKKHRNVEELVGFVQNDMAALDRCNDTDAYSLEHV